MTRLAKSWSLCALIALAGCSVATTGPARLSDRQAQELARALDGKVPGKAVSCVSRILGTDGLQAVTDDLLLYRVNRDLVYRNDLRGSCTGISRGSTLVLRPTNDQYCRNDIVYGVDLTTGMRGASCALGDFVPYRAAGR
ncbi:hypothetical protein LWE61_01175 [Sphingobium sufflavum]|uniref:hypothetical protein n=1 Tax=Sphingobium sufflavum TaxID=1129547 RepID=UPI001F2AB046|nr:hypothetical protein [Sphingobium sufflavum]MCE7795160.1 hypothetical protein [Sphingobium sufflavum]